MATQSKAQILENNRSWRKKNEEGLIKKECKSINCHTMHTGRLDYCPKCVERKRRVFTDEALAMP